MNSNRNPRQLKGYSGFSKKFPSKRGTMYAIGESKRVKKRELRNKIILTICAILFFMISLTIFLFCKELSRKPIPDSPNSQVNTSVSAENIGQIKALFIENSLLSDENALTQKLNSAKKEGYNAIMLDYKDEDGTVLFPSAVAVSSDFGEKVRFSDSIIQHIKNEGFTVVARIYCFCDSTAPQRLGAYVYEDTERTKIWFTGPSVLGGKVWLNPTDSRAVNYLLSIIGEASSRGADCIYLQSVEFATGGTGTPVFTEDDTSLSRNFILLDFIEKATKKAGDCPIIVGFSYDGIDGNSEKWGGTLFDSAAAVCSPDIPVTENYIEHVGNLWLVLNDKAKDNFTTLKVVPTVHNMPENEHFLSELASAGAESYIIIP